MIIANAYNSNNINENINDNKLNNPEQKTNTILNMSNNTYITEPLNKNNNKNININEEMVEIECVCDKSTYTSKEDIIQCILCHKYQHLECIYQAQYTEPYLCFNCQFKNNHFYLKWKQTILPAREIIYKKKMGRRQKFIKRRDKKV